MGVVIRFSLYLQRHVVSYLFLCFFVIWLIVILSQTVKLAKILYLVGVGIESIFIPLLLSILPYFSFIFLITVFISIFLTISKLCGDQELVAVLSYGFGFSRLLKSLFLFLVISLVVFVFSSFYLESWGREKIKSFLYMKAKTKLDSTIKNNIKEGVVNENLLGFMFFARKIEQDKRIFHSVIIAPGAGRGYLDNFLRAEKVWFKGSFKNNDLKMYLKNGFLYTYKEIDETFSITKFKEMNIDVVSFFLEKSSYNYIASDDIKSFNIEELYQKLISLKDENTNLFEKRRISYLFYSKIANILLFISFILFGLVFGISNPKQYKNFGILKCLVTLVVIHFFVNAVRWGVEAGWLSPVFGSFFAQGLVLIIAILLYWRRSVVPLWDKILL